MTYVPPIGGDQQNGPHVDDDLYGLAESADEADEPHGYVSDAELMAWLETKSDGQYADLREAMNLSNDRIKLIKRLNDLKTEIGGASSPEQIDKIRTEMEAMVHDAAGTPYAQDITELFSVAIVALDQQGENLVEGYDDPASDGGILGQMKDYITAETDKLGKVDSLALVQIQQLVSDAKETAQLASNVLSSRDQTRSGIVGNIRA